MSLRVLWAPCRRDPFSEKAKLEPRLPLITQYYLGPFALSSQGCYYILRETLQLV